MRVLAYAKFELTPEVQHELLAEYLPYAQTVAEGMSRRACSTLPVCRDASDSMFPELALTGKAEILVTGDRDLLALAPASRKLPFDILTPQEALQRLGH